jgi:prepilin-type N-terminal cleavage/methylation domain-containing protein
MKTLKGGNNVLTSNNRLRGPRAGFSIIELLVAIIIIGILVAILIPLVSQRSEQARVARVQSDLEHIAEAMQRVGIDTGYYIRLIALNDLLFGDADINGSGGVGFNRGFNPNDIADGLTDYFPNVANPFYQFPTANSLFIDQATGLFAGNDPFTGTYRGTPTRDAIILRLIAAESRYDATGRWGGPYLSFRSDSTLYNNIVAPTGVPTDPWGNDYILFTRRGMFVEPNGIIAESVSQLASGGFAPGGPYDCLVFDRPTVLSLGPNGTPGNGVPASADGVFGRADDYFRQF